MFTIINNMIAEHALVPMDYELGCFTLDRVAGMVGDTVYWVMACMA